MTIPRRLGWLMLAHVVAIALAIPFVPPVVGLLSVPFLILDAAAAFAFLWQGDP